MRERALDQATSITSEAPPDRKRQPERIRRAAGFMKSRSWRGGTGAGVRNRVGGIAVQRSFPAPLAVREIVESRPEGWRGGIRAGQRTVALGVSALETGVVVNAGRQPVGHGPH